MPTRTDECDNALFAENAINRRRDEIGHNLGNRTPRNPHNRQIESTFQSAASSPLDSPLWPPGFTQKPREIGRPSTVLTYV